MSGLELGTYVVVMSDGTRLPLLEGSVQQILALDSSLRSLADLGTHVVGLVSPRLALRLGYVLSTTG